MNIFNFLTQIKGLELSAGRESAKLRRKIGTAESSKLDKMRTAWSIREFISFGLVKKM